MAIIHPSPRHDPPITSPTLFNIIKHRRGRERVPPKPKENQPCFRASPPKIRASPPGIPSESPSESPLSMWCGVVAAASTSAAFFGETPQNCHTHLGNRSPRASPSARSRSGTPMHKPRMSYFSLTQRAACCKRSSNSPGVSSQGLTGRVRSSNLRNQDTVVSCKRKSATSGG